MKTRRFHLGQSIKPRYLGLTWTVIQIEDNGYVCECNLDRSLKQFFFDYQLNKQ